VHNVLLQILYLDSLEITSVDVLEIGTRCCVWTNQMVRLVSDLDTDSNGNFGALQVCPHSFPIFYVLFLVVSILNRLVCLFPLSVDFIFCCIYS
jgi:hypothetical protein